MHNPPLDWVMKFDEVSSGGFKPLLTSGSSLSEDWAGCARTAGTGAQTQPERAHSGLLLSELESDRGDAGKPAGFWGITQEPMKTRSYSCPTC